MTEYIELGGKLRPVSFAHRQQRFYEEEFKTPFAKDWALLMGQFSPMLDKTKDKDAVKELAANVSLVLLGNMFYSAFLAGYNLERLQIDFDVYDLTDWISADTNIVTKLTTMLVSANTTGIKGVSVGDAKKKTQPRSRVL
jgi:hypothetical protein